MENNEIELITVDEDDIQFMSDGQLDFMLGIDSEDADIYKVELELEEEKNEVYTCIE